MGVFITRVFPFNDSIFARIRIGQVFSWSGSQRARKAATWWPAKPSDFATISTLHSVVNQVPVAALVPTLGILMDRWNLRVSLIFPVPSTGAALVPQERVLAGPMPEVSGIQYVCTAIDMAFSFIGVAASGFPKLAKVI